MFEKYISKGPCHLWENTNIITYNIDSYLIEKLWIYYILNVQIYIYIKIHKTKPFLISMNFSLLMQLRVLQMALKIVLSNWKDFPFQESNILKCRGKFLNCEIHVCDRNKNVNLSRFTCLKYNYIYRFCFYFQPSYMTFGDQNEDDYYLKNIIICVTKFSFLHKKINFVAFYFLYLILFTDFKSAISKVWKIWENYW